MQDGALWDACTVPELASLVLKAVAAKVRPHRHRLVMAGVGYGGVIAAEAALQLHRATGLPQPLVLLEGAFTVRYSDVVFNFVPKGEARDDICQVATLLWPTIQAAMSGGDGAGEWGPSKEAFGVRLASLNSHDEQLAYIDTFKPAEVRVYLRLC